MASRYELAGRPVGIKTFPEPMQVSVDGATVTNLGPGVASYADRYDDLKSGSPDGTINPGASTTLEGDYWFSCLDESSDRLNLGTRTTIVVGEPPDPAIETPTLNAAWFGTLGTDPAGNTATIQAALDAAKPSAVLRGSNVTLPPGTYEIQRGWQYETTGLWGCLKLYSGVGLYGAGLGYTTLKLKAGQDSTVMLLNEHCGYGNATTDIGDSSITISSLTLDGNRDNNTGDQNGELTCQILLSRTTGTRINDLELLDADANGLVLYGAVDAEVRAPKIRNAYKFGVFVATRDDFATDNVRIIDPDIDGFDHHGICFDGGYGTAACTNVRVTGGVISNGTGAWSIAEDSGQTFSGRAVTVEEGVQNYTIQNVYVNAPGNYGIYVGGGQTNTANQNGAITGNRVTAAPIYGIYAQYDTSLEITDNRVWASASYGMRIQDCTAPTIKRNRSWNNVGHGIVVQDCTNFDVDDNKCYDNSSSVAGTYDGIRFVATGAASPSPGFGPGKVTGNRCFDTRGSGSKKQKYGISYTNSGAACTNILHERNDLRGNRTAPIYSAGIDGATSILRETGTGTPQSSLVSGPGGEWVQTDGSSGQVRWTKDVGTGNTGWRSQRASSRSQGQSGLYVPGRDIPSAAVALVSGTAYLQRFQPDRDYAITLAAFSLSTPSGTDDPLEIAILNSALDTVVATSGSVTGKLNGSGGNKTVNLTASLAGETVYYLSFLAASTATIYFKNFGSANLATLMGSTAGVFESGSKSGLSIPITTPITGFSAAQQVPFIALRES